MHLASIGIYRMASRRDATLWVLAPGMEWIISAASVCPVRVNEDPLVKLVPLSYIDGESFVHTLGGGDCHS